MKTDFLNSCYEEEKSLYKQIAAVQNIIRVKGGIPKHPFALAVEKPYKMDTSKFKSTTTTSLFPDLYNMSWTWENKTIFAFEKLKPQSTPSDIINYLSIAEPGTDKKVIANNVYNNINRLVKKNYLTKLDVEGGATTYALIEKPRLSAGL